MIRDLNHVQPVSAIKQARRCKKMLNCLVTAPNRTFFSKSFTAMLSCVTWQIHFARLIVTED
jgi:hypothetical protein